jgi:hypothetical protein
MNSSIAAKRLRESSALTMSRVSLGAHTTKRQTPLPNLAHSTVSKTQKAQFRPINEFHVEKRVNDGESAGSDSYSEQVRYSQTLAAIIHWGLRITKDPKVKILERGYVAGGLTLHATERRMEASRA